MKRILITCRVDVVVSRGERRDALDQRWGNLLQNCNITAVPVPNTKKTPPIAEIVAFDGIVISGGNDIQPWGQASNWAPERDETERSLLTFAKQETMPVLGVCRGMQMLNIFLGGTLSQLSGHVGVRHELSRRNGTWPTTVNSYHDLGITEKDLAPDLTAQAMAEDGTIEAVQHHTYPWIGIMWHPEREAMPSREDTDLIRQLFNS